jgi:hypothetical protein
MIQYLTTLLTSRLINPLTTRPNIDHHPRQSHLTSSSIDPDLPLRTRSSHHLPLTPPIISRSALGPGNCVFLLHIAINFPRESLASCEPYRGTDEEAGRGFVSVALGLR